MKFRPDVEGLRAVAIIPVVVYHASSGLVPGGYVGVDVFFVISGFLISGIILDDIKNRSFSFASFYRRRSRRIFPALFFMLACVSAVALFILPPDALKEFGSTLLATALFVSNMEFLRLSGYFAGNVELKPLVHTWSLAVEEQFYIVFPIILIVTKRWLGGRFLAIFLICGVSSLLLSYWLTLRFPEQAFFFGPARAYELLIGAVLALNVLPQLSNRAGRELVAIVGITMIASSAFEFDRNTEFPGIAALVPCLGAALVIYAGQGGNSAVGSMLSLPAIRFVGAISYSLYLWHWPVLALARNYYLGVMTPFQINCAVLLAVALAVFSRYFVERPFLRRHASTPVLIPSSAAIGGAAALGFIIVMAAGFPSRFSAQSLRLFKESESFNHRRSECHGRERTIIPYARNCLYGDGSAPPGVAIWGDSHGAELSFALGEAVGPARSVMQITASACPPALDFNTKLRPLCGARNQNAFTNLAQDMRINSVVLIARYNEYSDEWPKFLTGFERAVAGLVAAGKQVILVDPFPSFGYSVPYALGILVARGIPMDSYGILRSQYRSENARAIAEIEMLAIKYKLARINTEGALCGADYCSATKGGEVLYFDDNHLSVQGATRLAASIVPLLANTDRLERKKTE